MESCGEDEREGLRYDAVSNLDNRQRAPQTNVGPATANSGDRSPVSAFHHHSVSRALADAPLTVGP